MNTNPTPSQQANRRYLTVWRWHFYAGLFVVPFLTVLAFTGLMIGLIVTKDKNSVPGSAS